MGIYSSLLWRDTVTKKEYENCTTSWLYEMLAQMLRADRYSGMLTDTSMKVTKVMSPSDRALLEVGQSYYAQGMVKQLSESKQSHLNQMGTNFIPRDRWNELTAN